MLLRLKLWVVASVVEVVLLVLLVSVVLLGLGMWDDVLVHVHLIL